MPDAMTLEARSPRPGETEWRRRLRSVFQWPARLAMGLIRLYQATLSRALGSRCRFHPSCSQYTHDAMGRYGLVRGAWLGARRIGRCHPFHDGGFDPVP